MPTATEIVQRLRQGFSGQGATDGLDSDAMADAFVATIEPYADETFQCHMMGAGDVTWTGLEGLRAGWRDFLGGFDFLRILPEDLRENEIGEAELSRQFVRLRDVTIWSIGEWPGH